MLYDDEEENVAMMRGMKEVLAKMVPLPTEVPESETVDNDPRIGSVAKAEMSMHQTGDDWWNDDYLDLNWIDKIAIPDHLVPNDSLVIW